MTTNRAQPDFDDDDDSAADRTPDDLAKDDDEDRELAESLASEMAAVRERLAQVPAARVVANHAMGLYELGAIHLSQDPPSFSEATIAIDAMAALIDRLPGRLGDDEATLRESLAQLRMAFVMLRDRAASASPEPSA
jgi:hypothetical protein